MKKIKELESVYDTYPFKDLTKWQKLRIWIEADIAYFFIRLLWKLAEIIAKIRR